MGLKIRLARFGAKKRPYYQIVVSDSKSPRDGRFIEKIGVYNPMLPKDSEERVKLDGERATYWVKAGALPTDRVARFLAERGLYQWKHGANPNRAEPGKKMKERADKRRERDEAAKTAAEAAGAAASE